MCIMFSFREKKRRRDGFLSRRGAGPLVGTCSTAGLGRKSTTKVR
jgi:hypothetical protein